jgi:diphthine-ammonia ligase
MVYVAGQIPLVPASMELVTASQMPWTVGIELTDEMRGFIAQAALALQHLWRIGRAMNVLCWTGGVAFISSLPDSSGPSPRQRAAIAMEAWCGIHEVTWREQESGQDNDSGEDEEDLDADVDIWHLKNNRGCETSGISSKEEKDTRSRLPDYSKLTSGTMREKNVPRPPGFVVQVAELPRGAEIEWCSTGLSRCSKVSQGVKGGVYCTSVEDEEVNCQFIYRGLDSVDNVVVIGNEEASSTERKWVSFFTVYTTKTLPEKFKTRWKPQIIPCRSIWGEDGRGEAVREFEAVVVIKRQAS